MYEISDEELRRVQLMQLEMLRVVDLICKRHGIQYYLSSGTLLGAIKYQGFIPWDDDLDIMLLRDDYEKLLMKCKSELNDDYFLQHYTTDSEYHLMYAKIRRNNTAFVEPEVVDSNIHHGVYIDILPLDNIPNSQWMYSLQKNTIILLNSLRLASNITIIHKIPCIGKRLIANLLHPLGSLLMRHGLLRLLDSVSKTFCASESTHIGTLFCYSLKPSKNKRAILPRSFLSTTEYVIFEGSSFPAPKEWDTYLTSLYGNYSEPLSKELRKTTHPLVYLNLTNDYASSRIPKNSPVVSK